MIQISSENFKKDSNEVFKNFFENKKDFVIIGKETRIEVCNISLEEFNIIKKG